MISKEELNQMKSDDMQFILNLNELFVKIIGVNSHEEQNTIRKTPIGNYLWRVHSCIWDIRQNIEDIELAEQLIIAYDPGLSRLNRNINAGHRIRYNYENFFLRMGKMKDLFLLLINEIMMLKIKKGLNLEAKILKLLSPNYPNFLVIWGDIKMHLDELKPYRNHIAHNGFIEIPDLALVSSYYTFDVTHKNLLEEFRYELAISDTQSELVNKFSAVIKSHLANIDQFLKLFYIFLNKPFLDFIKTLTEDE